VDTKEKVKDVNDLQKMNLYDKSLLEKCFSDEELDMMYI
jgi:hypothetical protein